MEILIGTLVMTTLIVLSFYAGFKFADKAADKREEAVAFALKKQYARLMARVDADDPCQPYVNPDDHVLPEKF